MTSRLVQPKWVSALPTVCFGYLVAFASLRLWSHLISRSPKQRFSFIIAQLDQFSFVDMIYECLGLRVFSLPVKGDGISRVSKPCPRSLGPARVVGLASGIRRCG